MKSVVNRQSAVARAAAVAAAGVLLSAGGLSAETFIPTTGTNTWNATGNWVEGTIPNAPGTTATFGNPTGTRSATLDADISVGSISIANGTSSTTDIQNGTSPGGLFFDGIGSAAATVTVTAGGNPVVDGTGQNRITATMNLTDSLILDVQNNAASTTGAFSLLGIVQGAGGVTKTGTGRMTWAFAPGTNDRFKTYTGPTVINNGRVRMSVGARPTGTSSFTIEGGGQLTPIQSGTYDFGGGNVPLNITGTGPTAGPDMNFKGAVLPDANLDVTFTNPITLTGGNALIASRRATGSSTGSITLNNVISGAGVLQLTASAGDAQIGTYFIKYNANTYTGGTVVYGGIVDATQGNLGDPTAPLTVNVIEFGGASTTVLLNTSNPTTVGSLSGFRFANSSTINNGGQLFTANQTTAGTYDGVIAGAGGFALGSLSTAALTLSNANTYAGGTTVNAGTLVAANANAINAGQALTVNAGATLRSQAGVSTALDVSSLSIAATGRVDVNDGGIVKRNGSGAAGQTATQQITAALKTGLENGGNFDWLGSGISSTEANADNALAGSVLYGVGVVQNNLAAAGTADGTTTDETPGNTIYSSFKGRDVVLNDTLVRYTYMGDADLDGSITGTDYSLIDAGFAAALAGWLNGDFDYSGAIDGTDYALIDNAFASQVGPLSDEFLALYDQHVAMFGQEYVGALAAVQAVPEPGTLGVLALAGVGLLARRRARRA